MFVYDEISCDYFYLFPCWEWHVYYICNIDRDDKLFHVIKDIFYAKFTSVILPESVSRQQNMIIDKEIYLMHISTSNVCAHDILF